MNNILTFGEIAELLSTRLGIPDSEARDIIDRIQHYVSRCLTDERQPVTLPHIGTFSVSGNEIQFAPDATLADAVNEPFSFFEAVPMIDEDVLSETTLIPEEDSDINHDKQEELTPTDSVVEPVYEQSVCTENVNGTSESDNIITEHSEQENEDNAVPAEPTITADTETHITPTQTYEADENYKPTNSKTSPIIAFIVGLISGMIIVCIAVYFLYPPLHSDDDEYYFDDTDTELTSDNSPSITTAIVPADNQSDSVPQANTATVQPAQTTAANNGIETAHLTDTVSSTYFLATMSRKYFGRMEFWVYIYKENQDHLGHPDRIPSGTVVTIPQATKYGIDANNPESIKRAKALTEEIYAPYR